MQESTSLLTFMSVYFYFMKFMFQMGNLVCAPYLTSENGKQYIKGKALALKLVI